MCVFADGTLQNSPDSVLEQSFPNAGQGSIAGTRGSLGSCLKSGLLLW